MSDLEYFPGGLLHSDVPGRTDRLPLAVPPESYVIPADVVSALGQGNTMSGARILGEMFGQPDGHSAGGAAHGASPVIVAGGEWVVNPESVAMIGGGDVKAGHRALDAMVRRIRQQHIQTLKSLPGPKK